MGGIFEDAVFRGLIGRERYRYWLLDENWPNVDNAFIPRHLP
jgi:hypothetical protein